MKLNLSYQNSRGKAILNDSPFKVTHITGLGLPQAEYQTASYSGYDGQETLSSSYLPRGITLSGDIVSDNPRRALAEALDILSAPGYLYIQSEDISRRIYCNQIVFPETERIMQGKICRFAIQLVCDNPFFESADTISAALYERTKELSSPFTLPSVFGITVAENNLRLKTRIAVEPKIRIICPSALSDEASVTITNKTTGKKIELLHTLSANEEIVIDIKNRTVTSSVSGNIINSISDDTFLGDFRLEPFDNVIETAISHINEGIMVEGIYNDSFSEAQIL